MGKPAAYLHLGQGSALGGRELQGCFGAGVAVRVCENGAGSAPGPAPCCEEALRRLTVTAEAGQPAAPSLNCSGHQQISSCIKFRSARPSAWPWHHYFAFSGLGSWACVYRSTCCVTDSGAAGSLANMQQSRPVYLAELRVEHG